MRGCSHLLHLGHVFLAVENLWTLSLSLWYAFRSIVFYGLHVLIIQTNAGDARYGLPVTAAETSQPKPDKSVVAAVRTKGPPITFQQALSPW